MSFSHDVAANNPRINHEQIVRIFDEETFRLFHAGELSFGILTEDTTTNDRFMRLSTSIISLRFRASGTFFLAQLLFRDRTNAT